MLDPKFGPRKQPLECIFATLECLALVVSFGHAIQERRWLTDNSPSSDQATPRNLPSTPRNLKPSTFDRAKISATSTSSFSSILPGTWEGAGAAGVSFACLNGFGSEGRFCKLWCNCCRLCRCDS